MPASWLYCSLSVMRVNLIKCFHKNLWLGSGLKVIWVNLVAFLYDKWNHKMPGWNFEKLAIEEMVYSSLLLFSMLFIFKKIIWGWIYSSLKSVGLNMYLTSKKKTRRITLKCLKNSVVYGLIKPYNFAWDPTNSVAALVGWDESWKSTKEQNRGLLEILKFERLTPDYVIISRLGW